MKRLCHLVIVSTLLLLGACEAEQQYSTRYPCSFVFYAINHPTSALTHCLGNPGHFVIVTPSLKSGVTHLMLTPNLNNNWSSEQLDIPMLTAKENDRLSYSYMGANQRLIIGLSNFNGLKAYDGQCPNCLENGTSINRPLNWTDNGLRLICQKCQTKYDPNTNVRQGEVPRLIEYQAEYQGTNLYVHN